MVTKLYFHAATDSTTGLPSTEQSSLTENPPVVRPDALTTNRSMNTTIGISQTSIFSISNSTTDQQNYYFTRFVSQPLFQSSINANTWTYNFAAREGSSFNNFPVGSTDQPVHVNCYIWRPSTSTKIGTILDGDTAQTVDEGAASIILAHHVTFTGSSVSSMANNDVLIFEAWFRVTQATTGSDQYIYYFDGTTENTTEGATVSNHASYLETPEDLSFSEQEEVIVERRRLGYIDLSEDGLMSEIIKI